MTTRLLFATKNHGKVEELRRVFAGLDVELVSCDELGLADVEETGETFEANAILKARAQAEASGLMALADDSGLEVDALGGAPGVHSARWSGGGSAANIVKLLAALDGIPEERRTARFRCVLAFVDPEGPLGDNVLLADGRCEGVIAKDAHGAGGFGYDPVFVPVDQDLAVDSPGRARTMAELHPTDKDAISHRGRAAVRMREQLVDYLSTRG